MPVSPSGGGNRCHWQGGFYETVAPRIGLTPKSVVGAGASSTSPPPIASAAGSSSAKATLPMRGYCIMPRQR
jgi:hypothetical protein